LGTFWELLPEADKERMGELWQGYEQVFASVYQKFVEADLNISVRDLQQYATERWLPYTFDETTSVAKPAIYTSTQDLYAGCNLSSKFLIKFRIDGGDPIEVDLRGANPSLTTLNEIISKINKAVGFKFASGIFENSVLQLVSPTSGPSSSIDILLPSSNDATEFVLGLQEEDLPLHLPKYPFVYRLPYSKIVDIPYLQDTVREDSVEVILNNGADYVLDKSGLITFLQEPPKKPMWAKKTYFDEETPWNNFGFLMDIYGPNEPTYLSVIQGLWFSFWTGPKPENIKTALYLLFGLPVAKEDSVVSNVTTSYIETTSQTGLIRRFNLPLNLKPIVAVGQSLRRFQPLVDGIEVFDKINLPGFIAGEIGRTGIQRFLTDTATRGIGDTDETKALSLLEEHTFLPQISVDAFISPDINLGNVKNFLDSIKPLNKTFLFQIIVGTFRDELPFGDRISFDVSIDVTPNLDSNETTFCLEQDLTDYESTENAGLNMDSYGVAMQESIEVEVYQSNALIDSFVA